MSCACTCPPNTTFNGYYSCAEFTALTGVTPPPGSCCFECGCAPGQTGCSNGPIETFCAGSGGASVDTGLLIGSLVVGGGILLLLSNHHHTPRRQRR